MDQKQILKLLDEICQNYHLFFIDDVLYSNKKRNKNFNNFNILNHLNKLNLLLNLNQQDKLHANNFHNLDEINSTKRNKNLLVVLNELNQQNDKVILYYLMQTFSLKLSSEIKHDTYLIYNNQVVNEALKPISLNYLTNNEKALINHKFWYFMIFDYETNFYLSNVFKNWYNLNQAFSTFKIDISESKLVYDVIWFNIFKLISIDFQTFNQCLMMLFHTINLINTKEVNVCYLNDINNKHMFSELMIKQIKRLISVIKFQKKNLYLNTLNLTDLDFDLTLKDLKYVNCIFWTWNKQLDTIALQTKYTNLINLIKTTKTYPFYQNIKLFIIAKNNQCCTLALDNVLVQKWDFKVWTEQFNNILNKLNQNDALAHYGLNASLLKILYASFYYLKQQKEFKTSDLLKLSII